MDIGLAAEFRCVIYDADGNEKYDTGYHKNMILNQGLDFFGGGKGTTIFTRCVVGAGGSLPVATQASLDSFVASATPYPSEDSKSWDYNGSDAYYKTNIVRVYAFDGMGAVNIAELGLASEFTSGTAYNLCTRALIKDHLGAPTTLSIREDETLRIYYKLWQVFKAEPTSHAISLLDGAGGAVDYTATAKLSNVGALAYASLIGTPFDVGKAGSSRAGKLYPGELGAVTGIPAGSSLGYVTSVDTDIYVTGAFKRRGTYKYSLTGATGQVRSMLAETNMGNWQIRYGATVGDAAIVKTDKETLAIPFELSWSRYAGAL